MKKTLLALFAAAALPLVGNAQLLITGVVDGNEPGGIPKGIELFAQVAIPDLSVFSIGKYSNGAALISSVASLPAVSLAQGAFFYITGTSTSDVFFTDNGFTVGLSNVSFANNNGNDPIAIVSTANNATLIDSFGTAGQGTGNFYQDSVAVRLNTNITANPSGTTNAPGFATTAWVDSSTLGSTFGSYSPVPEPGTVVMFGLGLAGVVFAARRRKNV